MEIAILGMDANSKWTQWNLNDNSRATLPLGAKHEDTLPIGCAFNVGTTHFKIGDDTKQGPALLVLSDHGMLVMFNAINSHPGAMDICTPLENIADRSGETQFVQKQNEIQQVPQPVAQPVVKTQPVQQLPKPVASFPLAGQQLPQMPKLPDLSINPVSTPSQIPSQGLFGSSGGSILKPSATQAAPVKTTTTANPTFALPAFKSKPAEISFSSAFSSEKTSTPPPIATVVSQPQQKTPVVQQQPKTMTSAPPAVETPTSKPETTGKLPITEETEDMIGNLVREECLTLERELHDLLQSCSAVTASMKIGTDSEMAAMAKKELELEEFYSAIKDNINTHDSEVYTLKQALLQTWACYEEACTRLKSSKDPVTKILLQAMPLDPASQHQLDEMNRMMYYIDSQLTQANLSLDEQWNTFQDAMMKSDKLKLPTMESVYQSMLQHSKTLQKQKYILKHIAAKIKATNRARDKTLLNVTAANLESVGHLEEELSKLQIQQVAVPPSYNRLIERQSRLNPTKIKKLQEVLSNRTNTSRVSVSKPQLNNSTVQLSTLLAAPLSPIGKKPSGLIFDNKLINSTPKPKPLTELKMPKVPVQTFTPTTQAFGQSTANTASLSNITRGTPTNLFAKPMQIPATTTATIVPVPGPGNTSSAPPVISTAPASNTGFSFAVVSSAPGTTLFKKAVAPSPVVTTVSSGFTFAAATQASTSPFGFGTSVSDVKPPKPALLATPTTPPVRTPSIFGLTAGNGLLPVSTNVATSTTIKATSSSSLFSNTASTGNIFGNASTGMFGKSGTVPSAPSSTVNKKQSIFEMTASQSNTLLTPKSVVGTESGGIKAVPSFTAVTTIASSDFGAFASPSPATTTVAASTPSIFGNVSTSGTSLFTPKTTTVTSTTSFVSASMSTTSVSTPAFSGTSAFGIPLTSSTAVVPPAPVSSTFDTSVSAFGSISTVPPVTSAKPVDSPAPPAFGVVTTAATPPPAFGVVTTPTPTTVSTPPAFGTVTSSTPGIFGLVSTSSTIAPPAFPTAAVTTSSTPSVFNVVTTSTPPPAFGVATAVAASAPVSTSSGGIFGGIVASSAPTFTATTTTSSAFGTGSVFGSASSGFVSPPIFGGGTATTTAVTTATSPFGATPAFGQSTKSPFGMTSNTSAFSSSGNLFAQPAKFPTNGSIFGGGTVSTATTTAPAASTGGFMSMQSSVFGNAPATTSMQPSVFGNTPSTTSAFGGTTPFGGTSNSPFATATPPATTSEASQGSTGVFGSTFGSTGTFGGAQSPSAASPFASTGNVFGGFGGLSVGGTSTFGQSPASPAAAQNPFGAKVEQKSSFGLSTANIFATPASTASGGIFGSQTSSIFGGGTTGSTPFGSSPGFGQSSTFGAATPSSPGGVFSSGGTQSVQQAGFGSSFQKPAFGSGPVFGQPSAFGGNASFGSPPVFGGGATFGSPDKVFGGGGGSQEASSTPFGGAGAQNSTFGSIAQQDTVGFGNLAQQAATPSSTQPFSG